MSQRDLLLISGPSGGGKSTLLRQLRDGTLDPEILARLPAGSGSWPVLEANDVLKGRPVLETLNDGVRGVALHYDIVLMHRYHIQRYEEDPSLAVLEGAASLDLVFVRPDTDLVKRNFMARQNAHQKKKSAISRWWSRWVRLPMRSLLSPITGKPSQTTEDVYRDDKWLAGCYRQWETFLHRLVERHPNARLTIVEPAGEGLAFRPAEPPSR